MYGVAQIVNQNPPEVQHIQNICELSEASNKCAQLSDRAMKSSIHCANSIASINTVLKTDVKSILDVLDCLSNDVNVVSNDLTIMSTHLCKINASMYDLQDIIKDKFKAYDEMFEGFNRKLIEYGDLIKVCNRQVNHLVDESANASTPKPRIAAKPLVKRVPPKPTPK